MWEKGNQEDGRRFAPQHGLSTGRAGHGRRRVWWRRRGSLGSADDGRGSGGQGLVEFAMILPVLLLIVFGVINFGYIFAAYANLMHAAREGARYGMVNPTDTSGICSRVEGQIFLTGFDPTKVELSYPGTPGATTVTCDAPGSGPDSDDIDVGDDRVVVRVQHLISSITPLIPFSSNVDITARRTITAK